MHLPSLASPLFAHPTSLCRLLPKSDCPCDSQSYDLASIICIVGIQGPGMVIAHAGVGRER